MSNLQGRVARSSGLGFRDQYRVYDVNAISHHCGLDRGGHPFKAPCNHWGGRQGMRIMKKLTVIAALWVTLILPSRLLAQQKFDAIIRGGWVFRTDTGKFESNSGIGVIDGRFAAVKDVGNDVESGNTIELNEDQFILPGIVDCHAHYNVQLIKRRREEFEVMPIVYLANGVTVTFSCGEFDPENMLQLRKRIESGQQIGPHLINSGPYFGRARPSWKGEKPEDEIRSEVDYWAEQGVGGFKAKAISPSELRPLIEQAHKHNLTVTGHLDSGYRDTVNPRDAIEMGIDRVEHFLGGDAMPASTSAYQSLQSISPAMPEFQEITRTYVQKKIWFDATLTAYGYFGNRGEEFAMWVDERQFFTPYIQEIVKKRVYKPNPLFQRIYRAKQETIPEFWRAGGQITLGTDHFSDGTYLPGFGAHREINAFVRSGIPPAEVIKIATINGATALRIDKDYGSIENGKIADLFVILGNPLEQIRNTRNVQWVMRAGKIYDSKELLESVKGKLGPTDDREAKSW